MIRSSATSRHLVARCWARCAATETSEAIRPPSSTSQARSGAQSSSQARRGFRHLAMGNSSFPSHRQEQQQQQHQLSSEYQPKIGQSPSQHYQNKNSFGNSKNIQIRTIFVQTENTPNPESIKFLPSNTVREQLVSWFSSIAFWESNDCQSLELKSLESKHVLLTLKNLF